MLYTADTYAASLASWKQLAARKLRHWDYKAGGGGGWLEDKREYEEKDEPVEWCITRTGQSARRGTKQWRC